MDYQNTITQEVSVGKAIICEVGNERVLRGNMNNKWAEKVSGFLGENPDVREVRELMTGLSGAHWIGRHRDIRSEGEVIGGGLLLILDGRAFYQAGSTDFGSASAAFFI
jgi:hypothetical protein